MPLSNNLVVEFFEVFSCSGMPRFCSKEFPVWSIFPNLQCIENAEEEKVIDFVWIGGLCTLTKNYMYVLSISSGMCCLFWGEKKKLFSFNSSFLKNSRVRRRRILPFFKLPSLICYNYCIIAIGMNKPPNNLLLNVLLNL